MRDLYRGLLPARSGAANGTLCPQATCHHARVAPVFFSPPGLLIQIRYALRLVLERMPQATLDPGRLGLMLCAWRIVDIFSTALICSALTSSQSLTCGVPANPRAPAQGKACVSDGQLERAFCCLYHTECARPVRSDASIIEIAR
jgi:hypothetical protein